MTQTDRRSVIQKNPGIVMLWAVGDAVLTWKAVAGWWICWVGVVILTLLILGSLWPPKDV